MRNENRDLSETETRLAAIVDTVVDGIITIDEKGVIDTVNQAALRIFGYSSEEVVGQNVKILMPEPYHSEHDGYLRNHRETGKTRIIGVGREVVGQRKDGTTFPMDLAINKMTVNGQRMFTGVVRDITRRRKSEEALREAHDLLEKRVEERTAELNKTYDILLQKEEQLRGIMNNVVDGIITIDEQGRIESINPSAEKIFGYSEPEVQGRNIKILMPEPYRSEHDGYLQNYLRTGKAKILGVGARDVIGQRKDGSAVPLELAISEMRIGGRRLFIGALRDATVRKSAEAQLQQAQKMETVGQLTGGVAHDFNNLLSVILGNFQLLDKHIGNEERLRKWVGSGINAALRGAELTQRLLAFSRRQILEPKVLDINELVAEMEPLVRRTLEDTIEIRTVLSGELWLAVADPGQLENVLLNLAINARDAMPGGGKLTIETANTYLDDAYASRHEEVDAGPYVMLAVSDNGTGIPSEILGRVFEPFLTTKDVGKGSGLGLSMVYGFVKQSKGHVKIYSEEGQGTSVKIYLPRAEAARAQVQEAASAPEEIPMGSETILVVEDNEDVRSTATALLEELGYRVLEAGNAPAALALLDHHQDIDLLFTDVMMPGGMNGVALAGKVHEQRPEIKVLYTSGYTENAIVHDGTLDEGMNWLGKPYLNQDLARAVRRALGDAPR